MAKWFNVIMTVEVMVKADDKETACKGAKKRVGKYVTENGKYWADLRNEQVIAEREDWE